jgi:protoheme IX farnesyltransferase
VALAAASSLGAVQRPSARDLAALMKPPIIALLLLTALGAMFLAAGGPPPVGPTLAVLVGGALGAGGANALNHYFDRDLDEVMSRTRRRPLPSGRVTPGDALSFGFALVVASFAVLGLFANLLAASLVLGAAIFYVLVYTLWLKRTTTQNIVIGGAAGCVPPLVGWAAVTGDLALPAFVLFAIVFFWTPAHFWALATLIRDDYDRAGVPMLPVVYGERATAWSILLYAVATVALTVLLFATRAAGGLYLVLALALGVAFIAYAVQHVRDAARASARRVYLYSILYLAAVFGAMILVASARM